MVGYNHNSLFRNLGLEAIGLQGLKLFEHPGLNSTFCDALMIFASTNLLLLQQVVL